MGERQKQKLENAVHYICRKMAVESDALGLVKIHKILWMTDVKLFQLTTKPFIGGEYIRMPEGPFLPDMNKVLKDLQGEGRLYADKVDFHGYEKARLIGKGEPDTSLFSEKELRWFNAHIDYICNTQTATTASEKTHGRMWHLLNNGDPMPYEAEVVRFVEPNAKSIDWAKRELGIA